jgi:isoleucyl-tRNA synthetase
VRRSRRRFWKSDSDEDKQQAYQTLHKVLLTLCQLIAPVIPFTAESMYQNLKQPLANSAESVHLESWPEVDSSLRNDDLIREVNDVLLAVSLGHAARKDSKIKVRQPLARALIFAPTQNGRQAVENWRDTILDELNVKEIELLKDTGNLVSYSLRANLPKLGPKYGKQIGAIRNTLESATPELAGQIAENAKADKSTFIDVNGKQIELAPDEILIDTHQQSGYQFATEKGWAVALDTTLSDALIVEGLARDLVRAVQNARKDSGFDVSDHIAILLADQDSSRLPDILEHFGDYVQQETLAEELRIVDENYPELREATLGSDEHAEMLRFNVEKITDRELA